MKPALGWTMLSREEMRQVERSLANDGQETLDEIGFLQLHQGFADRFFPGTSTLHQRIRYALFVPWLYLQASKRPHRGRDIEATIRDLMVNLARRLKEYGREENVIGGRKLGQLTAQPPDDIYWSALRAWRILHPEASSQTEALRRLRLAAKPVPKDDDGGSLADAPGEAFCSDLPPFPADWYNPKGPLRFKMPRAECEFLRKKLRQLRRPDGQPALLARLIESGKSFPSLDSTPLGLPDELDAHADKEDQRALRVARDASALVAFGRAVYDALLEQLVANDGKNDHSTYREKLDDLFKEKDFVTPAIHCDLDAAEKLLPGLPVWTVLRETQAYVRTGQSKRFAELKTVYRDAEYQNKQSRARLLETERARQRRAEWNQKQQDADAESSQYKPLHYRWRVVHRMLEDLRNPA